MTSEIQLSVCLAPYDGCTLYVMPEREKKVPFSTRLNPILRKWLRDYAKAVQRTESDIADRALEEYRERHPMPAPAKPSR